MNVRNRRLCILAGLVVFCLGWAWYSPQGPTFTRPPHVSLPGMHADVERGLQALEQRVIETPGAGASWGEYGMALLAHQRMQEAIECFSEAIKLDPQSARWPYYLGVILVESDYVAARDHWMNSLRIDPKYVPARIRLMALLLRQNQVEQAQQFMPETLSLAPNDAQAHLLAARLCLAESNLPQAASHLVESRSLAPEQRDVFIESAVVARRMGESAAAAEFLARASVLPSTSAPLNDPWMADVYVLDASSRGPSMVADQLVQSGRFEQAASILEELHQRHPELSRPAVNRVNLLLRQGYDSQAIEELQVLIQQYPDDPLVQLTMAYALSKANTVDAAILHAEKAVQFKPDFAEAWMFLGQLHESQHSLEQADRAYRQAVSADPRLVEASQAIERVRLPLPGSDFQGETTPAAEPGR